jgi:putative NADPH-quinone reductase
VNDASDILIVLGSARSDGDAAAAARRLCEALGSRASIIDLLASALRPFDYRDNSDRDSFRAIVEAMTRSRHIVFVTPVYWYAMSGVMKAFFDRLTDLLHDPDAAQLANGLAGRRIWLLAVGTGESLPSGFHEPFAMTAEYLGAVWKDAIYVRRARGEAAAWPQDVESALAARLLGPQ